MADYVFIKKFVSQQCIEYDPSINMSKWHMVAEFTDGKTRKITIFLGEEQDVSGLESGWEEV
jgi:hypothetical protein